MGALCCKPTEVWQHQGCCRRFNMLTRAQQVDFDGPVDLWHFYLLRSVGKGAFGKVRVVQHKQTKQLYALKYINKQRCVKQHAVSNIIQERRMLEEIDSPFVCNLRYAFQDDENLFMVLDLMLGGDLRFHLDRQGTMKEDMVRFWMAQLCLALDYLHRKNIMHRDVKPDNVLLDQEGNAHLTDFNIAVHFTNRKALTSIAGSMAYMAPEILSKRGYTATVDWWSLGVVAYELLFGKRPFRGKTNSTLTVSIMKDPLRFPEPPSTQDEISPQATSFLTDLLQRDIRARLGTAYTGGLEGIKAHPWFEGMDWDKLERKELKSPFEPDSKKANFDATHELEELLLEDNPLKARKRNPNLDLNQMSADMRMMEENFTIYDYSKQPRRTVFEKSKDLDTATTPTTTQISADPSTSGIPLEDQPLAEMTSKVLAPSLHTRSIAGVEEKEPSASPPSKQASGASYDDCEHEMSPMPQIR